MDVGTAATHQFSLFFRFHVKNERDVFAIPRVKKHSFSQPSRAIESDTRDLARSVPERGDFEPRWQDCHRRIGIVLVKA